MSILLNPELEQRIGAKVESGEYRSADEVVERGLELLEARDSVPRKQESKDARPIGEIFEELGRSIPEEEWAKVPADLSKNLDHYLYGAPKESE